jgi:hypothetical protein
VHYVKKLVRRSVESRYRADHFGGVFGPGYPGHDDHTHVDIRFLPDLERADLRDLSA